MNGTGHEFFTGPALALDEHGGICPRDIANKAVNRLHLGVFSDESAESGGLFKASVKFLRCFFLQHCAAYHSRALPENKVYPFKFREVTHASFRASDNQGTFNLMFIFEANNGLSRHGFERVGSQGRFEHRFLKKHLRSEVFKSCRKQPDQALVPHHFGSTARIRHKVCPACRSERGERFRCTGEFP